MIGKLFKKTKYITLPTESEKVIKVKAVVPDGLYLMCKSCGHNMDREVYDASMGVCPKCGYHHRLTPEERLELVVDSGSFEELFTDVVSNNPLDFPDYPSKVDQERKKTNRSEAVVVGFAKISGYKCAIGVMDPSFMMGSMGQAVGERITRLVEYALEKKLPLIILTASGGARMQEGIFSLMQMAKTSIALSQFSKSGGLYISILTDPTTGGVTASFAMLGDIILAEPKALIGFAGPRVIEQTIRQKLPEGFQTSEFLLEHGFIDRIVERNQMAEVLAQLIKIHGGVKYEA